MSAADKPSEYLKRTCLICGCNTNQTINIYEPRSGPNIVELIQAKFKFQPLNEDKFLCFSCNNWLINWHSLQANNSNDAESPSGTFRSSQVNGGIAHEKRAENLQQQKQRTKETYRPIAQVRPQQLIMATEISKPKNCQNLRTNNMNSTLSKKYAKHYYAKRNVSSRYLYRLQKAGIKQLNACYVCGRYMVLFTRRSTTGNFQQIQKPKRNIKCRKCRIICQWRSIYMRSLKSLETHQLQLLKPIETSKTTSSPRLVKNYKTSGNSINTLQNQQQQHQSYNQSHCLKRPLVDGKVVAMLRRLGTTLSRECSMTATENDIRQLPPIMSPTKPKPRWMRPLEPDEILLNFETAISEVLPINSTTEEILQLKTKNKFKQSSISSTRRKLTYQMSCEHKNENETKNLKTEYQSILNTLPKGLNISLI